MERTIDAHGKQYQEATDGTCYDYLTSLIVVGVLQDARINHRRLRLFFGDTTTGKCWNEEHDVVGYIGRSTGEIKVPLLIANNRSNGGGAILDNCIVKIIDVQTHCTVYEHDLYHQSDFIVADKADMPGYKAMVYTDFMSASNVYARCKSVQSAERLAGFMNGTRCCK